MVIKDESYTIHSKLSHSNDATYMVISHCISNTMPMKCHCTRTYMDTYKLSDDPNRSTCQLQCVPRSALKVAESMQYVVNKIKIKTDYPITSNIVINIMHMI